jgi:hypothetical protein
LGLLSGSLSLSESECVDEWESSKSKLSWLESRSLEARCFDADDDALEEPLELLPGFGESTAALCLDDFSFQLPLMSLLFLTSDMAISSSIWNQQVRQGGTKGRREGLTYPISVDLRVGSRDGMKRFH